MKITRRLATLLSTGAAAGLLLTGTASAATASHSHGDASGADTVTTSSGIDNPVGITAGPDGALWFTNQGPGEGSGGSIGRITASGTITSYTDPSISAPYGITKGPDGALWFTNQSNNAIGRITTSGTTSSFASVAAYPYGITAGPDGALWFTNGETNAIGRITTGGTATYYRDPSINYATGITVGPDGALWFTNFEGNSIGRVTTGGTITTYTSPSISGPGSITAGPDGALWFTNNNGDSIGRITTSGTVTSYTDPSISSPLGITAGPDGTLWFTNKGNNTIGRITTSGTVTSYTDPSISSPLGITAGPDGALWFTNKGNNTIGRITTGGTVTSYGVIPSATTLAAAPNPSIYGQSVTFTATVSPSDGGGTARFSADGNPIPGCSSRPLSLVSGSDYQATCTTSALAGGGHVIEASYSGDTHYSDSSATITQTVNQQATTTTLSSEPNPAVYGQAVTFTAAVSPTDGPGTVSFSRGTGTNKTALCPDQSLTLVAGSYQASCTISSLSAATYTITAAYSGNPNYGGSTATVQQSVNKIPTATGVSSSVNPSRSGQGVAFTATVTSADGAGTVTFWYAGNTIAGCTSEPLQQSAGQYKANCATSSLPAGTDKVKAVYSGDKNSFGSTGTVSQVVNRIPTATKLKSSPNPSTSGKVVTLTATTSPTDGGGTIVFSANGRAITGCATKTLTGTGTSYHAVCKTSALPRGTDTVKAAYSGDAKYKPSSDALTQHVN
jgi:streptogramin lyase